MKGRIKLNSPIPLRRSPLVLILLVTAVWLNAVSDSHASPAFKRIISMSPAITEILFEIGAGDRVIAVTDFCAYPEETLRLPKIGGILNPSYETIISLRPDLIIHHYDSAKIEEFAKNLGILSLPVNLTDLKNILNSILFIGENLELSESANEFHGKLKSEIEFYRSRLQGHKNKSVLLLLGDSADPMRDLYAVGKNTFLGELLTLAGGDNILPESPAHYPKISKEFIITSSPEVIIIAGPMANLTAEEETVRKRQWARFSTVKAVQSDNIHYIGEDYILLPGPRLLKIIDRFAKSIHPEIFEHE